MKAPRLWMVLAAGIVALGTACSQGHGPVSDKGPQGGAAPAPCERLAPQRDGCGEIEVGSRTYRYVLRRAPHTNQTAVFDVGGPGAAVLGAGYPVSLLSADPSQGVLLLDEPWTTAEAPEGCDEALSAWYRDLRVTWPNGQMPTAGDAVKACNVFGNDSPWAFDSTAYRSVLEAIAEKEDITFGDFYGFSFGSTRWLYAGDLFARGTLISPFPTEMPATEYISARDQVDRPELDRSLVGQNVAGRSLPLAELDLDAAEDQTLYLRPRSRTELLSTNPLEKVVGRLSDQLFGRYGKDRVSHAVLAYWAETCPALQDWQSASSQVQHANNVTDVLLSACLEQKSQPPAGHLPPPAPVPCIVTVSHDGIVPASTTRWLVQHHPGWTISDTVKGGHASTAGLTRCMQQRQ